MFSGCQCGFARFQVLRCYAVHTWFHWKTWQVNTQLTQPKNRTSLDTVYTQKGTMGRCEACKACEAMDTLAKPWSRDITYATWPIANLSIWDAAAGLAISENSPSSSCDLKLACSLQSTENQLIDTATGSHSWLWFPIKIFFPYMFCPSSSCGESLNSVCTPSDFESAGR